MTKAKRAETGKNRKRLIPLRPDGNGEVTVLLPVTMDCNATGAICTADGRKQSSRMEVTVAGPNR